MCCLTKWCQRIWIFSMSPCPISLVAFFHHPDILVYNSILSSRTCIVLIHPCQLVHEIEMHAQPRRYMHILCTWEKQILIPMELREIPTRYPKFHFTQLIQIKILPSCCFYLYNFMFSFTVVWLRRRENFCFHVVVWFRDLFPLSLYFCFDNWYFALSKLTCSFFTVHPVLLILLSHPCV